MRVTLHRASRILEAMERHRRSLPLSGRATVSIFASVPGLDANKAKQELDKAREDLSRLLAVRASIRSAVAEANVRSGIAALLARKSSLEDEIAALEAMPGVSAKPAEKEEDDPYGMRRRRAKPAALRPFDMGEFEAKVKASKERYASAQAAESVPTEVDTSLLSPEDVEMARGQVVRLRRELDRVVEQLRGLNASEGIEISEGDVAWLEACRVV